MVLIIDDEFDICESIQGLLAYDKIDADICPCSVSAMSKLDSGNYACVITDICMPAINGIELSKSIKAKYPNIIVICISSYSDLLQQDLIDAKVDFCFPKPFSSESLVACVQTCLKRMLTAA